MPSDSATMVDRLGIPEAEKTFLAGVGAPYECEVMYYNPNSREEERHAHV